MTVKESANAITIGIAFAAFAEMKQNWWIIYLCDWNLDDMLGRWLNGDLCNGISHAEVWVILLAQASKLNRNLLRGDVSV